MGLEGEATANEATSRDTGALDAETIAALAETWAVLDRKTEEARTAFKRAEASMLLGLATLDEVGAARRAYEDACIASIRAHDAVLREARKRIAARNATRAA